MREPLACSLTGPELKERLAEIAAAGEHAVQVGDELRFPAGSVLRESGDELVLTIEAPDEARPVAEELRAAFGGRDR